MSKSKISVLTNAQALTVLRMDSGTEYALSGNLRYGIERRKDIRTGNADDKSCPSLRPLFNKGFISFDTWGKKDPNLYYRLKLTQKGLDMARSIRECNDE